MMRKNKFLMKNKETGDNTGETREDKTLSLAPPGYYNNICYQLLPTLAANIGSFSTGLAVGYPALLLRQLEHQLEQSPHYPPSHNNTANISPNITHLLHGRELELELEDETFLITDDNTNLIVQMFGVGVIFGAALASLLGHHYGRRLCLMLLAVPDLASWVMMASSTTTWMMLASRFLSGCAGGGYLLSIQVYVGEITSLDQRAWLLALSAPMTALGVLTMQVSTSLLSWHCTAATCSSVPLVLLLAISFYWETPYWLGQSSSPHLARQALSQYRGLHWQHLELELNKILQQQTQHCGLSTGRVITQIFSEKKYFKPFLILNSLNLLVLLCGKFAMDNYIVEVFMHFGSNLPEDVAVMISALLTLLASLILLPLVRWMARKSLLCLTSAVMGFSLLLLGLCSYSHHHGIELIKDCDWLPISCAVSYILATNMGLSALPNIFISEFYPSHMRIVMGGLTLATASLQMLAVRAAFSKLEQSVAQYVVLWFFSLVCLFVIVFTCQYVPETSNRDHQVVQAKFARLGKVVRASPWVSPCPSPSATSVRKLHFKTQLFTQ